MSIEVVLYLAGLIAANAAALLGAYMSLRERLTRIEVKVDTLERDVDGVAEIARQSRAFLKLVA